MNALKNQIYIKILLKKVNKIKADTLHAMKARTASTAPFLTSAPDKGYCLNSKARPLNPREGMSVPPE